MPGRTRLAGIVVCDIFDNAPLSFWFVRVPATAVCAGIGHPVIHTCFTRTGQWGVTTPQMERQRKARSRVFEGQVFREKNGVF